MSPLPRPLKYRSKVLTDLMRRVTPENIDEITASIQAQQTPAQPLIVRLTLTTSIEALRVRRHQFETCGALPLPTSHFSLGTSA